MCVHLSWPRIPFDCTAGSKRFYSFWRSTQVLLTIAFQLNVFQVQARVQANQEKWLGPITEGVFPRYLPAAVMARYRHLTHTCKRCSARVFIAAGTIKATHISNGSTLASLPPICLAGGEIRLGTSAHSVFPMPDLRTPPNTVGCFHRMPFHHTTGRR